MTTETLTKTKEVMIVGPGPSGRECPYDCETWVPDGGWKYAKRIDKVFCMGEWKSFGELRVNQMKFGFKIVAARELLGFDMELYPIEEVLRWAPLVANSTMSEPNRIGFFGNDVSYMIAYAVLNKYQKIRLYGIDILNSNSFLAEKGSMEYWMGVALGQGIKIWNAPGSVVCRTHNGKMYGDWGDKKTAVAELIKEFTI